MVICLFMFEGFFSGSICEFNLFCLCYMDSEHLILKHKFSIDLCEVEPHNIGRILFSILLLVPHFLKLHHLVAKKYHIKILFEVS